MRNVAASVRARLLARSREREEDFQLVLQRYAIERLLYRLGRSEQANRFVLKGAMLFVLWSEDLYRPTRDVDLLGYGRGDVESVRQAIRAIARTPVDEDGVVFVEETVRVEEIRDAAEYGGVRVRLEARLEQARFLVQIDIGFGDAVVPVPELVRYPTLLDGPAPEIRVYPREAVVAEKLHAMVFLGEANSRMKDFYDVFVCARRFAFDGPTLAKAMRTTFERRHTAIPSSLPSSLAPRFFDDDSRAADWRAFLDRHQLEGSPRDFGTVGEALRAFLWPVLQATTEPDIFSKRWPVAGPWQ